MVRSPFRRQSWVLAALSMVILSAHAELDVPNVLVDPSRFDQIMDYPEPHEVNPNLLVGRELVLECRYAPGTRGLPKTFKVLLEPTGSIKVLTADKASKSIFLGLWQSQTSLIQSRTTGLTMLFRRWKPDYEQDMEYLMFKCDTRPPVFSPNTMSIKGGEVWDEEGRTIGKFKAKLPHHRMVMDPSFKAYRSWIKQGFW